MMIHKTLKRFIAVFIGLLLIILINQIVWGISDQSAEEKRGLDNLLPISSQPLQFGGALSDDVVELGERVTLTLAARNNQATSIVPKLEIQLPPSLQPETIDLGDSFLFNSKEQMLYWYPVLKQGESATIQNISLLALRPTENKEGIEAVRLTLSEPNSTTISPLDLPVWVGQSTEPVAEFAVSDQEAGVGQKIRFINRSVGQPPLTFLWDFGDGQTATTAEPIHSYSTPGEYFVTLHVNGKRGEKSQTLPVQVGEAPKVELVVQSPAEAGLPFVAQAFSDKDATLMSWDMGDGIRLDGFWVEHVYAAAGDYLVTVNVTNPFGNTIASQRVLVSPRTDQADLSVETPNRTTQLPIESSATPTPDIFDMEIDIQLEADSELDRLILTDQLAGYINLAREMVGLHPLKHSSQLSQAAQAHTDDAAFGYVNVHIGADGSNPYDRVAKTNYVDGFLVGEATAWGFNSARAAVQFWLDSPDHRPLIFNREVDQVGVGQSTNYDTTYAWYWTAEFASYELPTMVLSYTGSPPVLPATATPTPSATPTASLTLTITSTLEPTIAPTLAATETDIPTVSATPSPSEMPTGRPVATPTIVLTGTSTLTVTAPATTTPIPQATETPVDVAVETASPTPLVAPTAIPETVTPTQPPAEGLTPIPTPESTESAQTAHPAPSSQFGETL